MAIEFRTAITIGGVNVAPGYPLLAGLTAGQVLRASDGTTVAFAALSANDMPDVLNAHGVRAARGANADGLWVAWQSGDTLSTFHAGGSNSSNDRIAVYGESYSSEGVRGTSTTSIPVMAIKTDAATNSSSTGIRLSHRSSGVIAAGLGIEINFMLQSSTTADMEVARISGAWTDPAHTTRTGDLLFGTTLSGTSTERMRLTSAGQLLLRSTDAAQASAGYFPWISGDAYASLVAGSSNSGNAQNAITARSGSGLGMYVASLTGQPLFAERSASTVTNTTADMLTVKHSAATPANTLAGFGAAISFQLSSTTTARVAGKIAGVWSDPVDASYTGALIFLTANNAVQPAEKMRLTGVGALWIGRTSGGLTGAGDLDVLGNVAIGGTFSLPTKTANFVYAGPTSGGAAVPAFRALVALDLPATAVTLGSYGSASSVATFTVDAAGRLTAAASTAIALAASAITSGQLALARGGSGADLNATGGANQIVRQNSVGGVFTVSVLAAADLPATAVTAGVYTNANITVDAAGRLTSAATGAVVSIPTSVVGYLPFYDTTTTLTSDAALFWDNTTKSLGIGTVAPTANFSAVTPVLTVKSATQGSVMVEGTASGSDAGIGQFAGINTAATGSDKRIGVLLFVRDTDDNSGHLRFYTRNAGSITEKIRILPSGNVGIGSVSPTKKLHIASAQAGDSIYMSYVGPSFELGNNTVMASASMHGTLALATSAGHYGLAAGDVLLAAYGNSRGNLYIDSNYSGTGTTDVIIQPSTGNVGIGTAAPSLQLETLMNSVYPAFNVQEASSSVRRATIGFGVNGTTATTGWIMGQSLGNDTVKDFYLNDATAGATRLYVDTAGFVGLGGIVTGLGATLDIVRPQAVQLRLASLTGSGTTFMAYSTGTTESLYLMVNRTYAASTFSRIDTGQASWTLSMGSQDADSFKLYRETNAGVLSTLLYMSSAGVLETSAGGTIRATQGTYAAPAAGAGLEIAMTGGIGYVQSYNRASPAWMPMSINASTITFGGGIAAGNSLSAGGNLTISGRLIPEGCTTGYVGAWGVTSINVNGNLLVSSAVFPGNQGTYYIGYVASPAGIAAYGNLSSYHDIFPGNNNGSGGVIQATYYFRGETNNGGLRTNGNLLVSGYVATLYNWNTGGLGTNQFVGLCSGGLQTTVFSGLGGYSYTSGGVGYNWGNINGGASGQLTGSNGGGYIRWHQDGQLHIASMNTSGTVGIVIYAGLNNVGIGAAQAGSARLFSKGVDATSSNNAFICQNSNASNLMYVRNDGYTWAYQAWALSDARSKREIRPTDRGLEHIKQLGVKRYTKLLVENEEHGLIAQELQLVMPELVSVALPHGDLDTGGAGLLSVNFNALTAVLVKAVQELADQVAAQQLEIDALRKHK